MAATMYGTTATVGIPTTTTAGTTEKQKWGQQQRQAQKQSNTDDGINNWYNI